MPLAPAPLPTWRMRLVGNIPAPAAAPTDYGEIHFAEERKFTFNLNKASTIAFKQDLRVPTVNRILGRAATGGNILLYRDGVLMMVAELTSVQTVGSSDEHSVSVVATETMWPRFQNTLLGKSNTGLVGPTTATDQGTWLNGLLNTVNAESSGAGTTTIGAGGSITASNNITGGVWYFKPFMELIQELGATTAGFDFWQTPVNPLTNSGTTGQFNVAPVKGASKPDAILEYGTGRKNAASYDWKVDYSLLANDIWVLPPDFPNNATLPLVQVFDATSGGARGFRHVVQPSDLSDTTLRTNFANLALSIRKVPRQQFQIQPMPNTGEGLVPRAMVDYGPGDTIRGRVVDSGITLLDAQVRIYGMEIALSEEGLETDTVTVIDD